MAVLYSKTHHFTVTCSSIMSRGALIWLKLDLITKKHSLFRQIAIAAPREVADVRITSAQDMQFTRELNARGIYVLD